MLGERVFVIETQKTGHGVAHGGDEPQFSQFLYTKVEKGLYVQVVRLFAMENAVVENFIGLNILCQVKFEHRLLGRNVLEFSFLQGNVIRLQVSYGGLQFGVFLFFRKALQTAFHLIDRSLTKPLLSIAGIGTSWMFEDVTKRQASDRLGGVNQVLKSSLLRPFGVS